MRRHLYNFSSQLQRFYCYLCFFWHCLVCVNVTYQQILQRTLKLKIKQFMHVCMMYVCKPLRRQTKNTVLVWPTQNRLTCYHRKQESGEFQYGIRNSFTDSKVRYTLYSLVKIITVLWLESDLLHFDRLNGAMLSGYNHDDVTR